MRAHDGAERRRHLDLGRRARSAHELAERSLSLGRLRIGDADTKRRAVERALLERPRKLEKGLVVPAHTSYGHDLSLLEGKDRLHAQQLPGPRPSPSDATSLGVELERVHREHDARLAPEALDERVDLLVRRAPFEAPLNREP